MNQQTTHGGAWESREKARCRCCGSEAVVVRLYDPDDPALAEPEAYCREHAPVFVEPEDDLEGWLERLRDSEDDPEALYGAALGRLRRGQPEHALPLLERLADRMPQSVAVWERIADAREQSSDLAAAITAQRRALELMPRSGQRHARLARLYALAGDLEAALAAFERGASLDRWGYDCFERAAMLRAARGQLERARDLLLQFLFDEQPGGALNKLDDPAYDEVQRRAAQTKAVSVDLSRPAATSRDFPGPLAFEHAELAVEQRRFHEVAAARYRAWRLLAHLLRRMDDPVRAARADALAPRELDGVPPVLLAEIRHRIGMH